MWTWNASRITNGAKDAISTLVSGKDLLAVVPNGFGKSLIFQMLVLIKQIMTGKLSSAVAVCPFQSIIYDQLAEAALTDCRLEDIESGKCQLIFASAEEVVYHFFLRLKIQPHWCTVIIISIFRSSKKEKKIAFRDNSVALRAWFVVFVGKRDFRCREKLILIRYPLISGNAMKCN